MHIPVIPLSVLPRNEGFLEEAVNSFNGSQIHFNLKLGSPQKHPTAVLDWGKLSAAFPASSPPTIIVTDARFSDNWFSHCDGRVAIISTANWFRLLEVPLSLQCYLLSEFALACAYFAARVGEDEIVAHEESVGCLFDMCLHKPDVLIRLRAGYICPIHLNCLHGLAAPADATSALQRVLNLARGYALSRDEDIRRLGAIRSRRVFIVHGRDDTALTELINILNGMQLTPVVLKNEPRHGIATIFQLIETCADVGYAIVLCTPDDVGGLAGDTETYPRMRQNVLLECGFFLGLLGRRRVSCLVKSGELELPSDLAGVFLHYFHTSVRDVEPSLKVELVNAGYAI